MKKKKPAVSVSDKFRVACANTVRAGRVARMLSRDRATMLTLRAIESALKDVGCSYVWLSLGNDGTVKVGASMYHLPSLKSGPLVELLTRLESLGVGFRTSVDYPSVRNRDFHGVFGRVHVSVMAYVADDSPVCRRVQVGERVEPVYQIVCDEEA